MTYEEIKRRLSKCEKTLELFKNKSFENSTAAQRQAAQSEIKTLNERIEQYKSLLINEQKTYLIQPKTGNATAVQLGDDEVEALKDADDVKGIKGVDGEKIKENIEFDVNQTSQIAKSVGKAVAKALKNAGDELSSMKARRIEPNSFDIYVTYKNNSDDEFSFYVENSNLHLVDFSFDKKIGEIGNKPSGEPIVNSDVLANELTKHFKASTNQEVQENQGKEIDVYGYQTKHFDICPGATKLFKDILAGEYTDGVPSSNEQTKLVRLAKLHDALFGIEKVVLKGVTRQDDHPLFSKAIDIASDIYELGSEIGLDANHRGEDLDYIQMHLEKINDATRKDEVNEGEGDDHHYIKVPRKDYKKAMSILNNAAEPSFVKMDTVDDDGAGNVIIYFMFNEFSDDFDVEEREAFMHDAVMDLQAQDIDIADHSAELDEKQSHPVMVQQRIAHAKKAKQKERDKFAGSDPKSGSTIKGTGFDWKRENKEMDPSEMKPGTYAGRAVVVHMHGPETEWKVEFVDSGKMVDYADAISNLKFDDDTTPTDYMQRRRAEKDYQQENADGDYDADQAQKDDEEDYERGYDDDGLPLGENEAEDQGGDLDVGHQDDEPDMLKAYVYDIAVYASKLYKQLDKYDKMDGEVDFPNWWQSKVILAKDYISKAQHYLEFEEKQPAIDQLALEGKYKSDAQRKAIYATKAEKGELKESPEQDEAVMDLRNLADEIEEKADEAREIVRQYFPNELSRLDGYGVFNMIYSDNRYNVTLGKFIDGLEDGDYDDLDDDDYVNEATDLYDRNGIQITRFSGGERGLMVQINYGGKYIHVPADEFAILARAMQSVIGDIRDMTLQMPRKDYPKNESTKPHLAIRKQLMKIKDALKQHKDKTVAIAKKPSNERTEEEKEHLAKMATLTKKRKELEGQLVKQVGKLKGSGSGKDGFDPDMFNDLEETELTKKDKKQLKDMSKSLKGSSKGHAGQAKYIDKLVKRK